MMKASTVWLHDGHTIRSEKCDYPQTITFPDNRLKITYFPTTELNSEVSASGLVKYFVQVF
jgi:hypothetical protein